MITTPEQATAPNGCVPCDLAFATPAEVITHVRTAHGVETPTYCINSGDDPRGCHGEIAYRTPLSGSGKSFPRGATDTGTSAWSWKRRSTSATRSTPRLTGPCSTPVRRGARTTTERHPTPMKLIEFFETAPTKLIALIAGAPALVVVAVVILTAAVLCTWFVTRVRTPR